MGRRRRVRDLKTKSLTADWSCINDCNLYDLIAIAFKDDKHCSKMQEYSQEEMTAEKRSKAYHEKP